MCSMRRRTTRRRPATPPTRRRCGAWTRPPPPSGPSSASPSRPAYHAQPRRLGPLQARGVGGLERELVGAGAHVPGGDGEPVVAGVAVQRADEPPPAVPDPAHPQLDRGVLAELEADDGRAPHAGDPRPYPHVRNLR